MKHIREKLLITLIVLLVFVTFYLLKIPCPILSYTNLPCPGCGMTRALLSALSLRFREALLFHPMVWTLPLLYLAFLKDGRLFSEKWLNLLFYLIIGFGFLLHWIGELVVFVDRM